MKMETQYTKMYGIQQKQFLEENFYDQFLNLGGKDVK